jgi:hypothetical protein
MIRNALLAALSLLWLLASPVWAAEPDACLACHGRDLGVRHITLGSLAWSGPVEAETLLPCPGVVRAKQELFLTESRLVRLSDALAGLEAKGVRAGELLAELHRLSDQYRTLMRQPVTSLSALSTRLSALRLALDMNVQKPMLSLQRARSRLIWVGVALVAGLAVLLAGMVGWRRRLTPSGGPLPLQLARHGLLDSRADTNEDAATEDDGGKP